MSSPTINSGIKRTRVHEPVGQPPVKKSKAQPQNASESVSLVTDNAYPIDIACMDFNTFISNVFGVSPDSRGRYKVEEVLASVVSQLSGRSCAQPAHIRQILDRMTYVVTPDAEGSYHRQLWLKFPKSSYASSYEEFSWLRLHIRPCTWEIDSSSCESWTIELHERLAGPNHDLAERSIAMWNLDLEGHIKTTSSNNSPIAQNFAQLLSGDFSTPPVQAVAALAGEDMGPEVPVLSLNEFIKRVLKLDLDATLRSSDGADDEKRLNALLLRLKEQLDAVVDLPKARWKEILSTMHTSIEDATEKRLLWITIPRTASANEDIEADWIWLQLSAQANQEYFTSAIHPSAIDASNQAHFWDIKLTEASEKECEILHLRWDDDCALSELLQLNRGQEVSGTAGMELMNLLIGKMPSVLIDDARLKVQIGKSCRKHEYFLNLLLPLTSRASTWYLSKDWKVLPAKGLPRKDQHEDFLQVPSIYQEAVDWMRNEDAQNCFEKIRPGKTLIRSFKRMLVGYFPERTEKSKIKLWELIDRVFLQKITAQGRSDLWTLYSKLLLPPGEVEISISDAHRIHFLVADIINRGALLNCKNFPESSMQLGDGETVSLSDLLGQAWSNRSIRSWPDLQSSFKSLDLPNRINAMPMLSSRSTTDLALNK